MKPHRLIFLSLTSLSLAGILCAPGCEKQGDKKIVTYHVDKESDNGTPAGNAQTPAPPPDVRQPPPTTGGNASAADAAHGASFTPSPGWQREPEKMMVAFSFSVPGAEGKDKAEMIATVFPTGTGTDLTNLNRWRGQVGLPPVTDTNGNWNLAPIAVGDGKANLLDLSGPETDAARKRLLVVIDQRGNSVWYFKLIGPYASVTAARDSFEAFLKSVKFEQ